MTLKVHLVDYNAVADRCAKSREILQKFEHSKVMDLASIESAYASPISH